MLPLVALWCYRGTRALPLQGTPTWVLTTVKKLIVPTLCSYFASPLHTSQTTFLPGILLDCCLGLLPSSSSEHIQPGFLPLFLLSQEPHLRSYPDFCRHLTGEALPNKLLLSPVLSVWTRRESFYYPLSQEAFLWSHVFSGNYNLQHTCM